MKTQFLLLNEKIKFFIVSTLFILSTSFAQTKVIAHKSHSGTNRTFTKAYKKQLFDQNQSNFGLPGNENIIVLDTIIAVNDSIITLKIRESIVCYRYGTTYKDLKKADFNSKTITLKNHKIINKKSTITFLKSNKSIYPLRFNNSLDGVVFVGFKK